MSQNKIGEVTGHAEGRLITLDRPESVRFRVGEGDDETIDVRVVRGELRIHSNSWAKNLAAIGESGNVLRLVVIER